MEEDFLDVVVKTEFQILESKSLVGIDVESWLNVCF